MKDIAIYIDKVTRSFGPITAINELSLSIPRGTIFGFLGPNGAGKTTTIHLLLGLLEPNSGTIMAMGLDTRSQAPAIRSRSGALLEHTGLYEQLSAQDNLDFYGRVWQLGDDDRQARIKELLNKMDMWERRHEKVSSWSKGMKQKLALARALIHRPEIIILDEPTAGLDVLAANAIREDLVNLSKKENVTIFLATHNMSEAEDICDEVAVIRLGKLLATGSPNELRRKTGGSHVEILGSELAQAIDDSTAASYKIKLISRSDNKLVIQFDGQTEVSPIINLLVSRGSKIEAINRENVSLESVFITLMEEEK